MPERMVLQAGALDETLAAAAGADPQLMAELRQAFAESLAHHVDLLGRARCDANWHTTIERIGGLAASFGVQPLIDLAHRARSAAPGEPTILRALQGFLADLAPGTDGEAA